MVSFRLIVFGAVRIAEPMIRDENDQAVLPSRKLLETVDEMPQRAQIVGVGGNIAATAREIYGNTKSVRI